MSRPAELPEAEFAHLLSPLALAITATDGMPNQYDYAPHLHHLSNKLVELVSRPPGGKRRLMVTMPPRHGKSELCSHWLPVWLLALDPRHKVILASYEASYAASWGRKARRSVQEHYPLLGARILDDSRAANRWETSAGGGMVTAGVGGPVTGRGGNVLILDDPIKNAEEANSAVIRENLWEWWTKVFLTRTDPDHQGREAVIVLILTRWHEDDLAGRILASPEAKLWDIINFPAIAEDEDVLGRSPGQALWTERFDELALETKKAEVGSRAFNALYQQRPTAPEGAAIQRLWWKWYDEDPSVIAQQCEQIIQSWDPTFDDADTSDFVVGQVWGRRGNEFYYLDAVRQRMNTPDTLRAIRAMTELWPQAKFKLIERSASGFAIMQILQREMQGIVPVGTRSRSKEVRLTWGVNSVSAIIERGQVFLPRNRSYSSVLVDEAAQFPHGAHDDTVDAMVQAIEYLMPKGWAHENLTEREKRNLRPTNNRELLWHELRGKINEKIKHQQRQREGREVMSGGGI
jgi:predicted phage terminase large subunit-like protein